MKTRIINTGSLYYPQYFCERTNRWEHYLEYDRGEYTSILFDYKEDAINWVNAKQQKPCLPTVVWEKEF